MLAAWLGHAANLCECRGRVGNELEAVERRDPIERAVLIAQRLDIPKVEPALGYTSASYLDQARRDVDAGNSRTSIRREAAERPCAAPEIEDDPPRTDPEPSNCVLVFAVMLRLLHVGPVLSSRAPQLALPHRRSLGSAAHKTLIIALTATAACVPADRRREARRARSGAGGSHCGEAGMRDLLVPWRVALDGMPRPVSCVPVERPIGLADHARSDDGKRRCRGSDLLGPRWLEDGWDGRAAHLVRRQRHAQTAG